MKKLAIWPLPGGNEYLLTTPLGETVGGVDTVYRGPMVVGGQPEIFVNQLRELAHRIEWAMERMRGEPPHVVREPTIEWRGVRIEAPYGTVKTGKKKTKR